MRGTVFSHCHAQGGNSANCLPVKGCGGLCARHQARGGAALAGGPCPASVSEPGQPVQRMGSAWRGVDQELHQDKLQSRSSVQCHALPVALVETPCSSRLVEAGGGAVVGAGAGPQRLGTTRRQVLLALRSR